MRSEVIFHGHAKPPAEDEYVFFIQSPGNDLHVTCRPLSLSSDIATIAKWYKHTHALPRDLKQIEEDLLFVYRQLEASSSVQAFMILLDEEPACVAEICDVLQDELGAYYQFQHNDYILRVLFDHSKRSIPGLFAAILHIVVKYCLSFPEVVRVIVEADDEEQNSRAREAGFQYLQKVVNPWNELHLYYMQREV